jgi:Na+:H+ antiporter, NhaA family
MTETIDRTDLFGGIALGIAALAALGIANSALAHYYDALIHVTVEIRIGSFFTCQRASNTGSTMV